MKTQEKGNLSIELNQENKLYVKFQPINGAVWMNRNELCELFSVYKTKIDTCLVTRLQTFVLRVMLPLLYFS